MKNYIHALRKFGTPGKNVKFTRNFYHLLTMKKYKTLNFFIIFDYIYFEILKEKSQVFTLFLIQRKQKLQKNIFNVGLNQNLTHFLTIKNQEPSNFLTTQFTRYLIENIQFQHWLLYGDVTVMRLCIIWCAEPP